MPRHALALAQGTHGELRRCGIQLCSEATLCGASSHHRDSVRACLRRDGAEVLDLGLRSPVGEHTPLVEASRRRPGQHRARAHIERSDEAPPSIRVAVGKGEVLSSPYEAHLQNVVPAHGHGEVLPARLHAPHVRAIARREGRLDDRPPGYNHTRQRPHREFERRLGDVDDLRRVEAARRRTYADNDAVERWVMQPARVRLVEPVGCRDARQVLIPQHVRAARALLVLYPTFWITKVDGPGHLAHWIARNRAVHHDHVESHPHLLTGDWLKCLRVDRDHCIVGGVILVEAELEPRPSVGGAARSRDDFRHRLARRQLLPRLRHVNTQDR